MNWSLCWLIETWCCWFLGLLFSLLVVEKPFCLIISSVKCKYIGFILLLILTSIFLSWYCWCFNNYINLCCKSPLNPETCLYQHYSGYFGSVSLIKSPLFILFCCCCVDTIHTNHIWYIVAGKELIVFSFNLYF